MKIISFLFTIIGLSTAFIGGWLVNNGVGWYENFKTPSWAPSTLLMGKIRLLIILLTFISTIIVWQKSYHDQKLWHIMSGFIISAALNIFWGYLFSNQQLIEVALMETVTLDVTIIALISLISPISKIAALLLLPYAGWAVFITYLVSNFWLLNR